MDQEGPGRSGRLRDRAERLNPVRRIASELQQDPLAGREAHREPEGQDRVEQEILTAGKRQIERLHVDREAAAGAVRPNRSLSLSIKIRVASITRSPHLFCRTRHGCRRTGSQWDGPGWRRRLGTAIGHLFRKNRVWFDGIGHVNDISITQSE